VCSIERCPAYEDATGVDLPVVSIEVSRHGLNVCGREADEAKRLLD
jgi:hypothetical protein